MNTVPGCIFTTLHFLRNLRRGQKVRVLGTGKPFQPNIMKQSSLLGQFISSVEIGVLWIRSLNPSGGIPNVSSVCFFKKTIKILNSSDIPIPGQSYENPWRKYAWRFSDKLERFHRDKKFTPSLMYVVEVGTYPSGLANMTTELLMFARVKPGPIVIKLLQT